MAAAGMRALVSKNKRRFVDEELGIDLDLSYVTPRLIAMGFPASGREGLYRNPASEVVRLLEQRHPSAYAVWNLCSERDYAVEGLFARVSRCPFPDHTPPPLELIFDFCASVDQWLKVDASHVAAVHCKGGSVARRLPPTARLQLAPVSFAFAAGKGRTGTMLACYLMASGQCATAVEALRLFGSARTHNGKGVTIPSQARYVWYFEQALRRPLTLRTLSPRSPSFKLLFIRFVTVPNFDIETGCDPYFTVDISNSQCAWG